MQKISTIFSIDENGSNLDLVGGGGSDAGQENNSNQSLSNDSKYKGAQG